MKNDEWTTEFPKEKGEYWFYGYRYGKISVGRECEPELMFVEVIKSSNGFLYNAAGQMMWESEVEEPHFKKADLPELPEMEK
jgi:hypothetical protein